jgi:hypothetical protein
MKMNGLGLLGQPPPQTDLTAALFEADLTEDLIIDSQVIKLFVAKATFRALEAPKSFSHDSPDGRNDSC